MVTSLSKRAANSGEKIVLAISLTLHHLPRQPLGGKVHLFGDTVQFDRSIFLHVEGGTTTVTKLHRLVREPKPAAGHTKCNLFSSHFNYCMMRAVHSVGGRIRTKQRSPRGPKFSSESCFEHQRLAVDLAQHDIDRSDDGDDIGEETAFAHGFECLQSCESWIAHMNAVGFGGAVRDDVVVHHAVRRFNRAGRLTCWNTKAFGHNLEVMDEGLHLGLHLLAIRQNDLRRIRDDVSLRKTIESL